MAWYAVYTHPRAEALAAQHLSRQGFETYLPAYARTRSHARRIETVRAPLFPRYLFVDFDPASRAWRCVRSTVGVAGLVAAGDVPLAVPGQVIDAIRHREGADGLVRMEAACPFSPGQAVEVAMADGTAIKAMFVEPDDERRVIVMLGMLGRQMRIRVSVGRVSA